MAVREAPLRDILGLIVALAAACGGKVADSGTESSPDGGVSPGMMEDDPNVCPHTVELRSFDVTVAPDQACVLAEGAPGCFSYACQPAKADCAKACSDPAVNACKLPADYLADYKLAASKAGDDAGTAACPPRDATVGLMLHCAVSATRGSKRSGCPVEGRRPAGLLAKSAEAAHHGAVADYLEQSAWLEAASVRAFDDLADDLERLDAPAPLRRACREAAAEERRHAALVGALVERFGGEHRWPDVAPPTERSAFEVALENTVEGVVRETFGAAVALFRAQHASDPQARAAMTEIAEDECRHAELACAIAEALEQGLTSAQREAIASASAQAIAELTASFEADPAPEVRALLGVPSAAQSRRLLDELTARRWTRSFTA